MGLVCSGKCGLDTVGPEPDAHTPTHHGDKPTFPTQTLRKDVPTENSDRDLRSERDFGSELNKTQTDTQEDLECGMPTRTLLVGEYLSGDTAGLRDPSSGVGAPTFSVNGRSRMNHVDHSPSPEEVTAEVVGQYLRAHPEFLEAWLMEQVELETLERWMIRRTQRDKQKSLENGTNGKIIRKTSLSRWKFCVHADKRKMLQELTTSLHVRPNKAHVLWELAHCISSAVSADGYNLYLADNVSGTLHHYVEAKDGADSHGSSWSCDIGVGSWLCAWVASTRHVVRVSAPSSDPRFPKGSPFAEEQEGHHALTMVVVQSDGELAAVLELYRKKAEENFHEEDEEIVNSYLVWGGIALHYADLYHSMVKQRKLNEFILSVVKSIFQDMVSMDTLIMKVMNFAQKLVSADRASLFLVDAKNRQLYARIFDMGSEFEEDNPPQSFKEIRFPIGTGIAGIVAQNGQVLNIPDAYADPRFNRTVDQLTGYVTKSILCMPIFIRGNVIGVMQMVNKATGAFSKEDEESFEMFAIYCGLALHHAKLYDKIRRSEQKYKVALEVLSYHNCCTDDELETLQADSLANALPGVDDYYFCPLYMEDMDKVRHAIYMFVDLFGLSRFDKECLIRFTLTVKKNYRRVPYHNWTHGFSVANSMYTIIKHAPRAFRPLECLALYIGSLCHDLDHRGKNNKFMLETESPLAAIYTTSTLEHHHFNQTVTILQQEGHNIFGKLTSNEYKQVLGNIKHCILATDLAMFFPNKARLAKLVEDNLFDWENPDHRILIEAIAMTACDLCASAKPWDVQVETVKVIFEEFYEQGDAEKAAGKTPIPMMDRSKTDEQAESQVGFLSGICIPCYELLYKLIPDTEPLLTGCKNNLQTWKRIAAEQTKDTSRNKEEDREDTDTGIQEVTEEGECEETLEEIDDKCISAKGGTGKDDDT
ncbi:probable 3',5'-cyclic phosphodiesterase pde-5 isoform X4 [Procambarus clarkii]|uniref:probable 3',5'-cyclic phosphodiesterase pde-5 isoform X4 n=1 Tax=Procambarus clarkii TaxID=6728 RepID=UPI001E673971|nr:probable 3',5'-cyclic phosphodiesterase pde-5 isoform X4 [Procambarus clarkii]